MRDSSQVRGAGAKCDVSVISVILLGSLLTIIVGTYQYNTRYYPVLLATITVTFCLLYYLIKLGWFPHISLLSLYIYYIYFLYYISVSPATTAI